MDYEGSWVPNSAIHFIYIILTFAHLVVNDCRVPFFFRSKIMRTPIKVYYSSTITVSAFLVT